MTAPTTMRAWRTHHYGPPVEALRFDEVAVPEPGPGEVRIRVQAIPLNLNDLERVSGGNMMVEPDLPYCAGMETMGIVDAAGDGAEALVGRRVAATTTMAVGGFAEYALASAASAFEIPDSIELPDAACLYFPFHLAWLGLFDRADLQPDQTVLIHAAAGGSGSAAIQLAKHRGATVIASVGSDAKKQLCLDLGADVVINYSTEDIVPVVMDHTDQRGVDVVFDNVGEAVFEPSMNCVAYNGHYLMMGFASNKAVLDEKFVVPRKVAMGNLKLCGVLLAYQADDNVAAIKGMIGANFAPASLGAEINRQIVDLVLAGAIRPQVGRVVGFEEIPEALSALAKRETVGRVVARLWE
ncbi:MAG: zinc-binding dehydrogenase [Acidimicrobiales bacterium]|nr:zinc-binding dehydrogenase [Acidimicrobiales bacterium]